MHTLVDSGLEPWQFDSDRVGTVRKRRQHKLATLISRRFTRHTGGFMRGDNSRTRDNGGRGIANLTDQRGRCDLCLELTTRYQNKDYCADENMAEHPLTATDGYLVEKLIRAFEGCALVIEAVWQYIRRGL